MSGFSFFERSGGLFINCSESGNHRKEVTTIEQFGIDISRYQGNFDLSAAAREGVCFVIVKGGGADDGYYTDRNFLRNYGQAKALGMPVGVYWFSYALTVEDAKKEAAYFYRNIVQGKQFELPVFIDVEHKRMLALDRSYLTKIVKTWCEALESFGCWVGIYSSSSVFRNTLEDDKLQDYTHWVAAWSRECPYSKGSIGFWQFGGETNQLRSNKVAGVVCDQDYMFRDYPALIKAAGCNGFPKNENGTQPEQPTPEEPEKKTVTQVAEEVIRGLWDNGAKRKTLLAAAGYDPAAVQQEVNRLLAERKKSPEEIAKEVIQGKWGNGAVRKLRLKKAGYDPAEIQKIVNKMLY